MKSRSNHHLDLPVGAGGAAAAVSRGVASDCRENSAAPHVRVMDNGRSVVLQGQFETKRLLKQRSWTMQQHCGHACTSTLPPSTQQRRMHALNQGSLVSSVLECGQCLRSLPNHSVLLWSSVLLCDSLKLCDSPTRVRCLCC